VCLLCNLFGDALGVAAVAKMKIQNRPIVARTVMARAGRMSTGRDFRGR